MDGNLLLLWQRPHEFCYLLHILCQYRLAFQEARTVPSTVRRLINDDKPKNLGSSKLRMNAASASGSVYLKVTRGKCRDCKLTGNAALRMMWDEMSCSPLGASHAGHKEGGKNEIISRSLRRSTSDYRAGQSSFHLAAVLRRIQQSKPVFANLHQTSTFITAESTAQCENRSPFVS
jgi:hypothetical protein